MSLLVLGTNACGGKTFGSSDAVAGTSGAGAGGSGGTDTGGAGGGKATGGSSGKAAGGAGASAAGGAMSTGGGPAGGQSGAGSGGDAGAASGTGGSSGAGTGGDAGASAAGSGGSLAGAGGIGTSGAAGSAGLAGAGGAPGAAECLTADDCVRVTDCCSCTAEPKNTSRPMCDLACTEDACFALGIAPEEVTCAFGRCVFDRSCNGNEANCLALPPECTGGTIPSVKDGCWGPCLPPTECGSVPNCDACTAVGAVCVRHDLQLPSVGCVEPGLCQKESLCECLDPCMGFSCGELEDAVSCYCVSC